MFIPFFVNRNNVNRSNKNTFSVRAEKQCMDWTSFPEIYKLRDDVLSTCLYCYYHDSALKVLNDFFDFTMRQNLRKTNDCQLNIEYAMGVCYCCLLKSTMLQTSFLTFHEKKVELEVSFVV